MATKKTQNETPAVTPKSTGDIPTFPLPSLPPISNTNQNPNPADLPNTTGTPAPNPNPDNQVGVFRNEQGNLSGVTLPDGRTFFGLSPSEVKKISEANQAKTQLPQGAQEIPVQAQMKAQAQQMQDQALQNQAIANQLGQPTLPGSEPQAQAQGVNLGQAITAGLTQAGLGAAGGAVVGSVVPGVGNVAGALTLGIGGFLRGIVTNIQEQRKGQAVASKQALNDHITNLNSLVSLAKQHPELAANIYPTFKEQLDYISRDHSALKLDTQDSVTSFLEDGTTQLADYARFYETNGQRDILVQQMQLALIGA